MATCFDHGCLVNLLSSGCNGDINRPAYIIPKPALVAPAVGSEDGSSDPDCLGSFSLPESLMYTYEVTSSTPTAYISYARVSAAHDRSVKTFAAWMANHGVQIILDLHHLTKSAGGIVAWFEREIVRSTCIIVVASPSLRMQWTGQPAPSPESPDDDSAGWERLVSIEAGYIRDALTKNQPVCIPVILGDQAEEDCRPPSLSNRHFYRLSTKKDTNEHELFLQHILGEHYSPILFSNSK